MSTTKGLYKKLAKKRLYVYYLYYFSLFFALGTFLPLFPVYLKEVALLTGDRTGFILSINPLVSIIFQPVWGIINEKYKLEKKIVLVSVIMLNISVLFILINIQFSLLIVFTFIFGLFVCAIGPIQDTMTIIFTQKYGFKYGDVRIWGSIGYACAAFISGQLSTTFGYGVIIILSTIFYVMTFISFLLIKQVKVKRVKSEQNNKRENHLLLLLKNKTFVVFLVFTAFSFGVLNASFNFYVLRIKDLGGTKADIGMFTSFLVLVEILVMVYVLKFNTKINDFKLIFISILIQIPLIIMYIIGEEYQIKIMLYFLLLKGISQGLFIPVMMNFISSLIPSNQLSSGIILYSSLSIGLMGYIVTLLGGFILRWYGYSVLFSIFIVCVLISLIFAFILNRIKMRVITKL